MRLPGSLQSVICLLVLSLASPGEAVGRDGKAPVPYPEDVKKAEKRLKVVLGSVLEGKPKNRHASLILERFKGEEEDVHVRYVGLRSAAFIASRSGDSRTVGDVVREIARRHFIDEALEIDKKFSAQVRKSELLSAAVVDALLDLADELEGTIEKQAILAKASSLGRAPASLKGVVEMYLALADSAVAKDEYSTALEVCRMARKIVPKARSKKLKELVAGVLREISEISGEFERRDIRAAREKLQAEPEDAEAMLAVGRFLCMAKGDWETGLAYLAGCSDASLRAVAEKDLGKPAEAMAQVALADEWWERAEEERGISGRGLQARAAHWYRRASPVLDDVAPSKVIKSVRERLAETKVQLASWPRLAAAADPIGYELEAVSIGDGGFDVLRLDGKKVYRAAKTGEGRYAFYMYFRAPPDLPVRKGTLYLRLLYKDVGSGTIYVQYNTARENYRRLRSGQESGLRDSAEYRTATWTLADADLRGAQNAGADLRLETLFSRGIWLHVVEATLYLEPPH